MEHPASSISVFCYPKSLLDLVMKFYGGRERGSGGAMMMRDAHARMHPDARDGPLSARRVLLHVTRRLVLCDSAR